MNSLEVEFSKDMRKGLALRAARMPEAAALSEVARRRELDEVASARGADAYSAVPGARLWLAGRGEAWTERQKKKDNL